MKFKILTFTVAFLLLFSVTSVAATPAERNIKLNFNDDYLIITQENVSDNAELIEKLGYTKSSFKSLFTEGSLVAFILHSESKSQIQIRAVSTDFSKQTEDISLLSDDALAEVAKQLVPEYSKIISTQNSCYIYSKSEINDSSGEYSSVQFVTVKNGLLYTVSVYCSEGSGVFETELLNSIEIKTEKQKISFIFIFSIFLILIFILGFLALAIYMIVLLVNQFRHREDNDVREFVRIKRRKF